MKHLLQSILLVSITTVLWIFLLLISVSLIKDDNLFLMFLGIFGTAYSGALIPALVEIWMFPVDNIQDLIKD